MVLACGRATRLVRFLTACDKDYEATIRFGITTDSYDITGTETGRSTTPPERGAVMRALNHLTGSYLQMPPAFSAKKVGGRRAYDLARRDEEVELSPAPVTVTRAELLELAGDVARVRLTCSAGFYVRTFAHSLGELTGAGACLAALRRTRSGEFALDRAIRVDDLMHGPPAAPTVPIDRLLAAMPAVVVADNDRSNVAHGQEIAGTATAEWVRLTDPDGRLLAVGRTGSRPGSLHPAVVLI